MDYSSLYVVLSKLLKTQQVASCVQGSYLNKVYYIILDN